MAFDNEFLKSVLENAETGTEDKIKLVMAEHDADVAGLKTKRDELLGKIKEKDAEIEKHLAEGKDSEEKILRLEEELKSKNPEDLKKMLENQFAEKEGRWNEERDALMKERDALKASNLKRIFNESMAEGVKDLNFMDGLKDGFVALVQSRYQFEPKEIDGVTQFYTKDMKTPKDICHEFALSNEGKAFIKSPWGDGGGATGSRGGTGSSGAAENPWVKGKGFNLTKQAEIKRTNPALAQKLKAEARSS